VARVDTEVSTDSGGQTVNLNPVNVGALALAVPSMPVDMEKDLTINVSGLTSKVKAPLPAELYVLQAARGWQVEQDWQPRVLRIARDHVQHAIGMDEFLSPLRTATLS
jgi:hypothetical protein